MRLAGAPESRRSAHTVPDDGVEATRVLWLEFHSLETLRELVLPAPLLLEDIAPRLLQAHARQQLGLAVAHTPRSRSSCSGLG